jgi:hypothetical protein
MKKFIAYCTKYNEESKALKNRNNEDLSSFKTRVSNIFLQSEGWRIEYFEINPV